MSECLAELEKLRRPKMLIRAARIGIDDYRREIHLKRLIDAIPLPPAAEAAAELLDLELQENTRRLTDDMTYSIKRHVEVLIALMGEARLMRASQNL